MLLILVARTKTSADFLSFTGQANTGSVDISKFEVFSSVHQ